MNRATWSARQAGRILLGLLAIYFVPPGAPIVLGADDTVERRSGQKITAEGCYPDAVRSTKKHVIRCIGLKRVVMMRLAPVPWSRHVWVLPFLTVLCRPADKATRRRHKTSVDGVRQMRQQARRWLPGRLLALVVDGGLAAVSLAFACVKRQMTMVSRLRGDAAFYHQSGPQPQGKRGPKPTQRKRQRSLQTWAERSGTPWETVDVDWYGGQCKQLWVFSHTALWYIPGSPALAIRFMLVCDPEGKLWMEAFFCTALQPTPVQILEWVVICWYIEVTFEEGRFPLGLESQCQWSDRAITRITPVLLGLSSLVTRLALRLSQEGQIPVPVTAWYHKDEPTFSEGRLSQTQRTRSTAIHRNTVCKLDCNDWTAIQRAMLEPILSMVL